MINSLLSECSTGYKRLLYFRCTHSDDGIPTLGIGHLRWALGALEVTLGAVPGCRTTRSHAGVTTRSPANTQLSEEEAKLPFKAGSYHSCDRVILQ